MKAPSFVVVIDADRCKACGQCIEYCPRGALAPAERMNRLGYHPVEVKYQDKCIGCQACVIMCPEAAIELYRRPVKSREVDAD